LKTLQIPSRTNAKKMVKYCTHMKTLLWHNYIYSLFSGKKKKKRVGLFVKFKDSKRGKKE
jgi:hypothetical protein